jgi:hypothetical protein
MKGKSMAGIVAIIGLLLAGSLVFLFPNLLTKAKNVNVQLSGNEQKIVLTKNNSQKNIHSISLKISGNVEGKAIIKLGYSDTSFYKIDTVQQQALLSYNGDWYQDSCFLTYQPLTSKAGNLKIQYKFHAL